MLVIDLANLYLQVRHNHTWRYPVKWHFQYLKFDADSWIPIWFGFVLPAHQKPVIATLTRLFNETSEAVGGARANAAKKREIEDNSKKFGALFAKLNTGDISKNAADKLVQLCQALDNGDYSTALQIQVVSHQWMILCLVKGCDTCEHYNLLSCSRLSFVVSCFYQVLLTTSEWDECSFWLGNLKRMIKARQNVRLWVITAESESRLCLNVLHRGTYFPPCTLELVFPRLQYKIFFSFL